MDKVQNCDGYTNIQLPQTYNAHNFMSLSSWVIAVFIIIIGSTTLRWAVAALLLSFLILYTVGKTLG
jgi:hypothetical protein